MGFFGRLVGRRETIPGFEKFVETLGDIEKNILGESDPRKIKKLLEPLLKIMDEIEASHPELHETVDKIGFFVYEELPRDKGNTDDKKRHIADLQALTSRPVSWF